MMRSQSWQRVVRIALSLVLACPFLLHASGAFRIELLERLEHIAYDTRLGLTLPHTRDERIVIVDIDEDSLAEIGQWPWSRTILADMVDRLFDQYRVRALGFDMVFAEPERSDSARVLRQLAMDEDLELRSTVERALQQIDADRAFAEAIEGRNVVLGYFFRQQNRGERKTSGMLPRGHDLPPRALAGLALPQPAGYGANLQSLQESAAGGGFFDNPLVSSDGVFRRVPLLQNHGGQLYEMLALATARAALDWPRLTLEMVESGTYRALEAVRIGGRRIAVDGQGALHVPYRGRQGSFPYVSAKDILDGSVDPELLNGRIALVGTTAAGLLDLRTTPMQNVYPGVEIQASVISGILDGRGKHQPAYAKGLEVAMLGLLGLSMSMLLPFLSPAWVAATTAAIAAGVVTGNLAAWSSADLVLPIAPALALTATLFVVHVAWGFFVETRGKRRLARLFGQYVPPELVDEMDRAPERITLEGESREMTVLFSDVRGFTSLSEGLAPSELTRLMNAFLTPMTRVIHQHRGTIDKYMGDAIMAFWGAPLSDPEHARHALLAAREMVTITERLGPEFRRQGWPPIEVGVGLNTGVMSVGNMGSQFRMAYTALGDAVNLGSRLEGLTRTYGVPLVVSESTRAAVPDFAYREIDVVRVKGKEQPVAIFEPIGPEDELDPAERDDLERYHEALRCFRACDWEGAAEILQRLAKANPDRLLYRIYLERISLYRDDPPPADWDGVFTHASK
ncbi:MAG: adenylate/guanylate cyclase domain-containing protein [Halofilum sp. (in: g-proteobacteria)]